MLDSYVGDTVLDIFSGSGTTCWVADGLSRQWIGIDNDEAQVKKAILKMQTKYVPEAYVPVPKKLEFEIMQLPEDMRNELIARLIASVK